MAVYGISDLHLSFSTNKPMNIFGKVWDNYEERIKKNWKNTVSNNDTVIIPGDISWAMKLGEAIEDYRFIDELPGKKIILKGNHDYYFSTKNKMEEFFKQNSFNTIEVLHNNCIDIEEYIICGTRGWGKTESKDKKLDEKLILREEGRLKISLEQGNKIRQEYKDKGISKKILVALHFPPFISNFQNILKQYDVGKCIYGHLHGYGHQMVKQGSIDGIEYVMVGCDYTNFKVIKL